MAPLFSVLAGVALIVVAAFVVYLPSLNGGFIFDDEALVINNSIINASDGLYRIWFTTEPYEYYPVAYSMSWCELRLWGMNPTGYHVTNFILHVIESLLIWIILRKLFIPGAFLAAFIFAVHPVNVESVAWIAQWRNTRAMLFFLLSILCYLKMEALPSFLQNSLYQKTSPLTPGHYVSGRSPIWYWLSLVLFILAMLSKGSVVVLPVLLLGIIWWLRPLTRWDLARVVPFIVIAVIFTVVNVWFQTKDTGEVIRTATFTERLLGAGGVVWFYLYKALIPIDLAFVYPQWHIQSGSPLWWLPLLAVLAATAVLWWYRKSWSRPFLFAWGFFCAALLPVLGITDVGFMKYSLVADHYQHIAIIGAITLVAAGWSVWYQRTRGGTRWAATFAAILAAGVLSFLTWRQSAIYNDAYTFYRIALEKNPDCWMAYNNLGLLLDNAGRPKEAMAYYEKALSLKPDDANHHYNIGLVLAKLGRQQEAIEHYKQALTLKPNYVEAQNNLGVALFTSGRFQEAIEHYQQALRLNPNHPEAHNNLGLVLAKIGRPLDAIKQYEQTLALKPDYPETYNNLGNAYKALGQYQRAITHYEQALRLNPDYIDAHNNLGLALFRTGRPQEAIGHYQQILRLKPDIVNVYYNLALAYSGTHQPSETIAAAEKAVELARSQGHAALAKQIEDWLNSYKGQATTDLVPRDEGRGKDEKNDQ